MFYLDTQSNTRHYHRYSFSYGGRQYTKKVATHETFTVSWVSMQVILQQRPDDHFYVVSGPDNMVLTLLLLVTLLN